MDLKMTNPFDLEYLTPLSKLVDLYENDMEARKMDRTGVGTVSLLGAQTRYDMIHGLPVLTTKKINYKAVLVELLWFLNAHMNQEPYKDLQVTNIKYLIDNNVGIWTEWCYNEYLNKTGKVKPDNNDDWANGLREFTHGIKNDFEFAEKWGDLGDGSYTKQWRNFDGVDQIEEVLQQLRTNPNSRRIRVTAWNPKVIKRALLPPCHTDFQFISQEKSGIRELSIIFNMRSNDYFLGNPFNVASYATLLQIIAELTGMKPRMVIGNYVDCHLYLNHYNAAKTQLSRDIIYTPPTLKIHNLVDINTLTHNQFELIGYEHHPFIWAPVAV
jgi:thymidylate synthase